MGTYLTKGTTFTTGDTVTAGALNNLVDNATVTAGSIGSAELAANSVTADKISTVSPQPVTTNTIRDNAIDNSKLNNMGSQTVKLNATNGSADPQDLGMVGGGTNGSSKILMGTNNSLSVLTATQFKMVDASGVDAFDSTASKLQLNTTAISDWDTVALATDVDDDADRLLLWDYDPLELKQISPKKLIQSLPATTSATGVVKIATGTELSDPFDSSHSTELALSPKGTINCPIFAKAWCSFTTNVVYFDTAWASVPPEAQSVVSASTFNIAAGIHTKDGGTAAGGVQQTDRGVFKVTFTTAMPNTNYIVIGNGWLSGYSTGGVSVGTMVSKNLADFTFSTAGFQNYFPNVGSFQLLVFALG